MNVDELSPSEIRRRSEIGERVRALQKAGVCPTCRSFEHGDVYPQANDRVFYEDDVLICLLEAYPRNPGHTIVLLKAHYEDVSFLPDDMVGRVYGTIHAAISALKEVTGAAKVYLCTMCDGDRNHLHYQLIPRLPGDEWLGSRVFVKPRGRLSNHEDAVTALRIAMTR